MEPHEVIVRPVITEKNTALQGQNKYAFEVTPQSNKGEIKKAIEQVFKVKVTAVNIVSVPGKMRRQGKFRGMTPSWKKAVVTLKAGDKIELFEGV